MKISKRILSLILVMALLFSAIPMGAAAASDVVYGIAFTKANLRLRSEASTSSSSLATASKGEVVLVLSKGDLDWYKVSYNGQEGYIPSALGYKNGGYSTDITRFDPGTGEELAASEMVRKAYLGG